MKSGTSFETSRCPLPDGRSHDRHPDLGWVPVLLAVLPASGKGCGELLRPAWRLQRETWAVEGETRLQPSACCLGFREIIRCSHTVVACFYGSVRRIHAASGDHPMACRTSYRAAGSRIAARSERPSFRPPHLISFFRACARVHRLTPVPCLID